jgi:hypothetical protein
VGAAAGGGEDGRRDHVGRVGRNDARSYGSRRASSPKGGDPQTTSDGRRVRGRPVQDAVMELMSWS